VSPPGGERRPSSDPPTRDRRGDEGAIVREYRQAMTRYSFIGIEFGCAVAFGVFGGRWLDERWGTAPWMMIALLLLGFAAAGKDFVALLRRARRLGGATSEGATAAPESSEGGTP
jgi:ATP synthase protein I